jgi:hypothetical protein
MTKTPNHPTIKERECVGKSKYRYTGYDGSIWTIHKNHKNTLWWVSDEITPNIFGFPTKKEALRYIDRDLWYKKWFAAVTQTVDLSREKIFEKLGSFNAPFEWSIPDAISELTRKSVYDFTRVIVHFGIGEPTITFVDLDTRGVTQRNSPHTQITVSSLRRVMRLITNTKKVSIKNGTISIGYLSVRGKVKS